MNLILFDSINLHTKLFPLTMTRPISKIRVGIYTIAERWEKLVGKNVSFMTVDYLQNKFALNLAKENILINGAIIPDKNIYNYVQSLQNNEGLFWDEIPLAIRVSDKKILQLKKEWDLSFTKQIKYGKKVKKILQLSDIFQINEFQIKEDIEAFTIALNHNKLDKHTICYSKNNIHVGKNTTIRASFLDADEGPIFIDDEVIIQPGAIISGPCAILKGSVISLGAKIRPNTTIGPYCKIGGEVSQVVFQGYSNKSHDGFLGSSVIGEWCNFGAGTNNSNLKNNYSEIKIWDYTEEKLMASGLQYFGLVMGDHSKCGINTMFNTGTIVGFSANIYGGGYMPKFIPSYSWGSPESFTTYQIDKALSTAKIVMNRRSVGLRNDDEEIFKSIFHFTSKYRKTRYNHAI